MLVCCGDLHYISNCDKTNKINAFTLQKLFMFHYILGHTAEIENNRNLTLS